jgi:predicted dienelactone hydrolase
MRRALLPVAIAAVALQAAACLAPTGERTSLYKVEAGPLAVVTEDLTLTDDERGKDLPIRVTYPDTGDGLPVVIFSHGAYGSRANYVPLARHWASHGYVVIQPTHEDSVALGQRLGDPAVFQLWQTRLEDVPFLIESLDRLGVQALAGRIDGERIGVGGHSYGAHTAQYMGGLTSFSPDYPDGISFGDDRVDAIAVLSGQGLGEGRTEESWSTITRPMLVMTGSEDPGGRTGDPVEWRIHPFDFAPPGDKYLLFIEGADHGFGGMAQTDPPNEMRWPANPDHLGYVLSATTAFWDAYLRASAEAKNFLAGGAMDRLSEGEAIVKAK